MNPDARSSPEGRRLLVLINDVPYFLAHRMHVAVAALRAGVEVHVAGPDHPRVGEITGAGLAFHGIALVRSRFAWVADPRYVAGVAGLIRRLKPTVVHAITIKPVLLGGLAARLTGVPLLATIPGLGTVFADGEGTGAKIRRAGALALYRVVFGHPRMAATFETHADRDHFVETAGLPPHKGLVVPGAGVDLATYVPRERAHEGLRVLFASRLLRSKGVEAVVAAAELTADRPDIVWRIAGWVDPGNPDSLTEAEAASLATRPNLEFIGHVAGADMPALIADVDAVVLPTVYPEGIPRILIEAAACGAVPISTDIPGAREIIANGRSGLLLREPTAAEIARAVLRLADDPAACRRIGAAARAEVEAKGVDAANVQAIFVAALERLGLSENPG